MAASGGKTVGYFLWKFGNCCFNLNTNFLSPTPQVLSRQLCVSAVLHRKNLAAAGSEKFSEEFIKKQVEEFNIRKRHLANMMGEDPETFTQGDINRSIAYLFPSSLFDNKAKPLMKVRLPPGLLFLSHVSFQWGADRRPFHFLFYTGKQSYYSLMHDTFTKALAVEKHQDRLRGKDLFTQAAKQMISFLTFAISQGNDRLTQDQRLGATPILPCCVSRQHARFIQLMERLLSLPYCSVEEDFVQRYRRQLEIQSSKQQVQPLQYDQHGVAYSTGDARRKTATGTVLLRDSGSGSISINGTNYVHYFPVLQDRSVLGRFDMQCIVSGGGHSSQVGALRLSISRAMLSFLTEVQVETMRQAGLLTPDPRIKERKKPGQEGARRKFTWKKR
uniref:Mitochondrial ribosomal protein S9 n=1 Tax=Oncorhynchus mykiss TaxID=8022 RepID=A0A8C7PL97_ONCMY